MDDMESRLGAILGNPDMMAQIMSMAQKLGGSEPVSEPPSSPSPPPAPPPGMTDGLDPGMLMKIAAVIRSANIDPQQRALLAALQPYLLRERISKLEKAMRAARLANMASELLGSALISQPGR